MKGAIFFCLVALVVFCNAAVEVKNLAGPPTDFPSMSPIPSPLQAADVQNSASFPVNLSPSPSDNTVLSTQVTLTVDSSKLFQFITYSPHNETLLLSLKNPNGASVLLQGKNTYFPVGELQMPGTQFSFKDPVKGDYTLTIQTKPLTPSLYSRLLSNVEPDAYVYMWNEASLATHTVLNTYSLLKGNKIGLVSRVIKGDEFSTSQMLSGQVPTAIKATIQNAEMNVILPDGKNITRPMVDTGLMDDGEANDGVYGGLISANVTGQYIFSANVEGLTADGVKYVRTTQQLVTVVEPSLQLTGSATGTLDSTKTRLTINLAATASVGDKYKAYAEVWGVNKEGKEVAVAWIGGMTYVQSDVGMISVPLILDLNWVSRAEAKEPLVLKNVKIQDPATSVPLSIFDMIPVKTDTELAPIMSTLSLIGKDGEITNEMREGKRPERFNNVNVNATEATIVLVHGYCTAANPFLVYPDDWTNAQFYLNPLQNYDHDEFALDILKWAETFGAYSYVGHSQGGAAGLHLKNFYWSGMDLVQDGRILQSVGTPYQGSGGAGKAADLAKVFGVLCGANQDLTHDGAALWLTGVTPENKKLVHFYTSTYVQGKFFGDYCNMATNLVLAWPNDGVTEQEFGQLPGGTNEGNTEGWCHSVDMKYTPQCQNRERNKLMNSLAARKIKNN